MDLDPVHCYRAFVSHDRRFDGRVFAGVVTTGVYCRPVCPVRPAKLENSRFFACAAAAEAAGFRPCRRCRPETAPGTPAWMGTSAVVARAHRLLCNGALDAAGVEELASRVGMGGRQLRRLFERHLGASPAEIARARRTHFARNLIDQTNLPMTEVALSAGFTSIRQFNHTVRATFGSSPTALRRRRRAVPADGGLVLRLSYRPPLDWPAVLGFLAERATPGVEAVESAGYRRTIVVHGTAGWIEARPDPQAAQLLLRVQLPTYDALPHLVTRARRLFDLDADPLEVALRLRRDPLLRARIEASPGLRVPGAWEPFELAVSAVLQQHAAGRRVTTLAGRLARAFGEPMQVAGGALSHVFPRPEVLAAADVASIGLGRACSLTLRSLATAVASGTLVLDSSRGLDDAVARLVAIPGLAESTAHYIAMRALSEPDAFPRTDLDLRGGARAYAKPLDAAALAARAERWRPWRAYAAMYLWMGKRHRSSRRSSDSRPHVPSVRRQRHATGRSALIR